MIIGSWYLGISLMVFSWLSIRDMEMQSSTVVIIRINIENEIVTDLLSMFDKSKKWIAKLLFFIPL